MIRSSFVLLLLLLFVAACGNNTSSSSTSSTSPETPEETIPFRVDGTLDIVRQGELLITLDIEIAEGDSAVERGMMQRESFPPNSGMLFLFDNVQRRTFWMGNTPVALDLLFISPDSQIVDFAKYAKPFSDESIPSAEPAQFVLEVPAGFVDSQGLVEGDQLRWRRTDGE